LRRGRTGIWYITYGNRGSVDVPLPLLKFTVPGAEEMYFLDSPANLADSFVLLALDDDALLPTLAPGHETTLAVTALPDASRAFVDARLELIPGDAAAVDDTPLSWDDIPVPPGVDPAAWQVHLDDLAERLGHTVGEYYALLMEDLEDLRTFRFAYAYMANVDGGWVFGSLPEGAVALTLDINTSGGANAGELPPASYPPDGGASAYPDGISRTYFVLIADADYKLEPRQGYVSNAEYATTFFNVQTYILKNLRPDPDRYQYYYDSMWWGDEENPDQVLTRITDLAGLLDGDDELVIWYVGHGDYAEQGKELSGRLHLQTGPITPEAMQTAIAQVGAYKTFLVLDTCWARAFANNVNPPNTKMVKFSATGDEEQHVSFMKESGTIFSTALKQSLREGASLQEAFSQANKESRRRWRDGHQEPSLDYDQNDQAIKDQLQTNPWQDPSGFYGYFPGWLGGNPHFELCHSPCFMRSLLVGSVDPNDKVGPVGGSAEGHVGSDQVLAYTVRFENQASATAPAQEVVVTDALDPDLDLSTLELTAIGFNDVVLQVPPGLDHFAAEVQVSSDPNPVRVRAALDVATGVISWTMTSVDPTTGGLPEDPWAGFLPPNDATGRGEGFVSFVVRPQSGLPDGTVVANQASIVFDVNDPIWTNVVTNTLDGSAPTSSVDALLATSPPVFTVSWSGEDAGGAGIAAYDIFVSTDGGPFAVWQSAITATQAIFTGTAGTSYGFYSVAYDGVGNRQATPAGAQATTTVLAVPGVPVLLAPPSGTVTSTQTLTFTWRAGSGAAPEGYNLALDGTVITTTATSWPTSLALGTYTWTARAFNASGVSAWVSPGWRVEVISSDYRIYLPLVLRRAP
jgi:hypothetical protein